jgi:hypothetical protein
MKTRLFLQVSAVVLLMTPVLRAQTLTPSRPLVGELRTFALPTGNVSARTQLHHDGWIEADGRVLAAGRYQQLFKVIGRTWTPANVGGDEFAVPDLRGRSRRGVSSDNPYGVLGPGDLVTSGLPQERGLTYGPIDYWIFTGQDLTGLDRTTPAT